MIDVWIVIICLLCFAAGGVLCWVVMRAQNLPPQFLAELIIFLQSIIKYLQDGKIDATEAADLLKRGKSLLNYLITYCTPGKLAADN